MKQFKKYLLYGTILSAAAGMQSCKKTLDEYNPANATADATWSTPEGYITAVNAAYSEQRFWYGKEDGFFMGEAGTDLWYNRDKNTYARQMTQYDGLTPVDGNPHKNSWRDIWKGVNQANAAINRIDQAGFTDPAERNRRLGEVRFLRAFYYWHIVETWGGVMLRTTETQSPVLSATRSSVADFYNLIFSDLEFAAANLPNSWGNEYSRATKKSALGFLARAYLSRAYYSTGSEAQAFFTKARDVANEVINRRAEFGVELWSNYADLFNPANNKTSISGAKTGNKEALYIVSNSVNPAQNYDNDGNRSFHVFTEPYPGKPGLVQSQQVGYGYENNRRLMPTLTLLDLYNETIDARYDGSFQEVWIANAPTTFTWNAATATQFNKDASVIGKTIAPGDTAMVITKKVIADKRTRKYVVFDRNDVYNPNGSIVNGNNYVALKKFQDPDRTLPNTSAGSKDVLVMRLAEMYLIIAEAEMQLGNNGAAATAINVLRTRAARPGQTAAMQVAAGQINPDFILDERAREFAGEYIRWFDVKRMKTGQNGAESFAAYIKRRNPDITKVQDFHRLRPVPIAEQQALLNWNEFGQNPGY
ncbi:MAG: RagB/SusD family nutrient uptake outer membrane protein [Chitinophagaceae bacterium]|nr:MAG: RagB/SusD family nutrient uptake outer membrane protein [Chitinophagaceae bacterium]